jgi:hypothetical protein
MKPQKMKTIINISKVVFILYYSLLWGRLCEHVTVTDGCRLYNLYMNIFNTQQLISDAIASPIRM